MKAAKLFLVCVICIINLIASTLPTQAAPSVIKGGYCYVDGKWIKGTLMSAGGIRIENGVAYVDPPWAFVGEDGTVIGSNDEVGELPWKGSLPEGGKVNEKLAAVSISDNGLMVIGNKPIKVEVIDVQSGAVIYSEENLTNLYLSFDKVLSYGKNYLLILDDRKNSKETIQFVVGDDEILIKRK